jgi:uncharacterized protein YegJ (DUF2314 family)
VQIGRHRAVALVAFAALCSACAQPGDPVYSVSSDDAEMQVAIASAREQLPRFWQAVDASASGDSDFALKVAITDSHATEHFWVTDIERDGGRTFGVIANEPNAVRSVRLGERIEVSPDQISDWLFMRDGRMVGNYTLRVMLDRMPMHEADALRAMLADP